MALAVCAHAYLWAGQLTRARAYLDEQYRGAVERDLGQEAGCLWFFAFLEWRAGNWTLAQERAARCCELLAMLDPEGEIEVAFPLATIAAHRGDEAAARELAEDGLRAMEAQGQALVAGGFHGIIGQLELWSGDPAAAVGRFVQAARNRAAVGYGEPAQARYNADHVEALVELGRLDDALAVLEPWEAAAVRLDRAWALAETTRCRGFSQRRVATRRERQRSSIRRLPATRTSATRLDAPARCTRSAVRAAAPASAVRRARRSSTRSSSSSRSALRGGSSVRVQSLDRSEAACARTG
jgi:hypothetical protein